MNKHKLDADRIKRRALLFREQYPGSTLAGFADDILNVLSVLDVSEDRAGELQALLESLTPGGSEFHDSPENCTRWIGERLASVVNEVRKRKEAEALLTRLTKSLCNCNCSFLPPSTLAVDPEKHHEGCVYRRAAVNTYVYANGRESVEENGKR